MHQEEISLCNTRYREALNKSLAYSKRANTLDSDIWKLNLLNKTGKHIYHKWCWLKVKEALNL